MNKSEFMWVVVGTVFGLDRLTKLWAVATDLPYVLHYASELRAYLMITVLLFSTWLFITALRAPRNFLINYFSLSFALSLGAVASHTVEVLVIGAVVDFIQINIASWVIIHTNIADLAIFAATIISIISCGVAMKEHKQYA
ncbi:hypothetical protein A2415_02125 [candidate division WWE3 bacterium RIFOXYC1_FULL_39_7]|uniref:Signal peptidase II n=2 Tax=Katanobacteria TaxID=422282 RepID=A0A1F4X915_UNCKA|nr:MAG: hypothetical protein A2415_02125 [candidate division WWE3 bacterium RIFOXYC1_FULL_39_7]OGC78158.1 MAG: hypothetical protein A2619_01710 [candidate division WWE3 bacterium RIFOXYD1_FULL_39_9]